ncbi:MAG: DUF5406 domain-containing protein [Lachnospiraceae bacterium]|nr:DUF5406 domain-containing protein [Lachnospiraceae bacterium]
MSKAILIMDMPKCCSDCHYCNNKNYKNPSCALTNYADGFQSMTLENIHNARQSWCPLVPMPNHAKKDAGMKSYDPNIRYGIHTIKITLQQWGYTGHITIKTDGYCKGKIVLDFDFYDCCEFNDISENDCNLKFHEDCENDYFTATLKDPEGNTLDVDGYAEDFNNMIVKMEIVDFRKE